VAGDEIDADERRDLPRAGERLLGERKVTIAWIVGGIVACATGLDGIPLLWREAMEPLPIV
jgi:hypothetical protein